MLSLAEFLVYNFIGELGCGSEEDRGFDGIASVSGLWQRGASLNPKLLYRCSYSHTPRSVLRSPEIP